MRLQLSIHRHALPAVQIIFTTGTVPASHTKSRSGATIADLLHDLNELVPLESSDGEWGLEDYVVEVAATADQDALYECLHFQTVDSVLRDDDEVVIRALGSEELRSRRLGGRLQISGDGKHLIDGVVFGKRLVRQQPRPGVVIPPRKRRRMIATEEEDIAMGLEQSEPLKALTAADDREEEDGDYEDKENIDYDKAVTVREDFDDADEESEEEIEAMEEDEIQLLLKDAEELDEADMDEEQEVLERHLKGRTTRLGKRKRDAVDDGPDHPVFEGFSTPVKSLRPVDFEDEEDNSLIESTLHLEPESDVDSVLADSTADRAVQIEANILGSEEEAESSNSSSEPALEESSDDEDSLSEVSANSKEHIRFEAPSFGRHSGTERHSKKSQLSPQKPSKKPPMKERPSESNVSDSEDSTSSSDESVISTSSSLIESDSTSSSGSEGTTDFDSSSSSDSESEAEADRSKKTTHAAAAEFASKLDSLQSASSPSKSVVAENQTLFANSPRPSRQSAPGQGLKRTQKKNDRVKMKKRLKLLKEAGELPAHADFSDLRRYQEGEASAPMNTDALTEDLESARARLLNGLEEHETEMESGKPSSVVAFQGVGPLKQVMDVPEEGKVNMLTVENDVVIPNAASEPAAGERSSPVDEADSKYTSPAKRAKLDIAASRRLLFGSLGLRTPKTRAEEQALREKLTEKARPLKPSTTKESLEHAQVTTVANTETNERWQNKLTVSAVECVREGVTLPPPPFPFVQNWHKKGKNKSPPVDSTLHYDGSVTPSSKSEGRKSVDGFAPDVSSIELQTLQDNHSNPESRTLSFDKEADGIPIPTDFNALAPLGRSHLAKGTIIAYKEIYVGAETNFQPEISAYRVAEVDSVGVDGLITVILCKRDRTKIVQHDAETGEAVSNNFEIVGSQDEDDGIRELEFAFMLEPKLVEAAKLQVPESSGSSSLRNDDGDGDAVSEQKSDLLVPESIEEHHHPSRPESTKVVVEQIDIDTPRRKEITTIIKEAGFESAMGEYLFEPLPIPRNEPHDDLQAARQEQHEETALDDLHEGDDQGPCQSNETQNSSIETSKVVLEKSRVEDWSSSPLFPGVDEETGMLVDRTLSSVPEEANSASSPPVSPQLTVEYPHVSQMDLHTSAAAIDDSTRLSSHQDAQKVPVVLPGDPDLEVPTRARETEPASEDINFHDDDNLESLESGVAQNQSLDQQDEEVGDASHSFLGKRGYDGHGSSYHESDDDPATSDRSSSLPSLCELTSSQKRKIASTGTKSGKVSPPPLGRNNLLKEKGRKKAIPAIDGGRDNNDNDEEDAGAAWPASSSPAIKVVASQPEKPRSLSQIPIGSQVVDLTMSSDHVSADDNDSEYGVMRPRRARRLAQVNGASKPKTRSSTISSSVSEVGIGTKRFLTTKKTRSQAVGSAKDGGYF